MLGVAPSPSVSGDDAEREVAMSFEEHLRDLTERYPPDVRDPRDHSQTIKNIHAEATYRAALDAVHDYGQRLHAPRPRRTPATTH